MNRLFGTDGVRGIAGSELTPALAYQLGRAGAFVLSKTTAKPNILVGKDTRLSGDMLESALVAGICSAGATAILLGVLPTPAVAYLTRERKAAAGVVISASHNPAAYNGIKFFSGDGYKLPDEIEDEIQSVIEKDSVPVFTGADIGRIMYDEEAKKAYATYACQTISCRLDGMRLCVDCANGANSRIAPDALRSLGADVTAIHDTPDGLNINLDCGSTHLSSLSEHVKKGDFDLGIAFDGDADRVLFTDENGAVIDGDQVMAICAIAMQKAGTLSNSTLVATIMSNLGLTLACKAEGIHVLQTSVGDRYVLEAMRKGGHCIGGEQSGHIIFANHATTGDGLISALQFLQIIKNSSQPVSSLAKTMTVLPQVLCNAHVSNTKKNLYKEDPVIQREISRIEALMEGTGRVVIRPSGTEPSVRVMIEGTDIALLEKEAKALAALIASRMCD